MKTLKNKINSKKGFTLVELLVVIAIIAILSVTAYVALSGQTGKARDSRRQQDLSSIQTAVELYFVNNNSEYPKTLDDLKENEMREIPTDPSTGEVYIYATEAPYKTYQLGATLEGEEGDYEAYVIGNSDTNLIEGVDTLVGQCGDDLDPVEDGSKNCVPMKVWND